MTQCCRKPLARWMCLREWWHLLVSPVEMGTGTVARPAVLLCIFSVPSCLGCSSPTVARVPSPFHWVHPSLAVPCPQGCATKPPCAGSLVLGRAGAVPAAAASLFASVSVH